MVPCYSPGCELWIRRLIQTLQKNYPPFAIAFAFTFSVPFFPTPPVSRTMDLRKPLGSLSAFHCMLLTDTDEEVTGLTPRLVLASAGNLPPAEFLRRRPPLPHRRLALTRPPPSPRTSSSLLLAIIYPRLLGAITAPQPPLLPPTRYRLCFRLCPPFLITELPSPPCTSPSRRCICLLSLLLSFFSPCPLPCISLFRRCVWLCFFHTNVFDVVGHLPQSYRPSWW